MPDRREGPQGGLPYPVWLCGTDLVGGEPLTIVDRSAETRALTAVGRWLNDITPGIGPTVLTTGPAGPGAPGIYYNLAEGEIVYIKHIMFALHTASDEIEVELGFTDAANGAGTFIPVTPEWHLATGAAASGSPNPEVDFAVPIRLAYAGGVRSVTVRIACNDANAAVTVGYQLWVGST